MRVISGSLGGRNLISPKSKSTHPMSDLVKGALFNSLGDITNLSVLDAFSGSGSLAIEAYSRGAKKVVAIESNNKAYMAIKENIASLKISDKLDAKHIFFNTWSNNASDQFDIIIADPPYNKLLLKEISKLPKHLINSGILVLSWPRNIEFPNIAGLKIIKHNYYGDANLAFYNKVS